MKKRVTTDKHRNSHGQEIVPEIEQFDSSVKCLQKIHNNIIFAREYYSNSGSMI